MKYLLIVFILGFSSIYSFGQNTRLELKFGPGFGNMMAKEEGWLKTQEKFLTGLQTCVKINQNISNSVYLGFGLGYYQRGFQYDVTFYDKNAVYLRTDRYRLSYYYLGIPLSVGLMTNGPVKFIFETGVIPELFLNSKLKIKNQGETQKGSWGGDNPHLTLTGNTGLERSINDQLAVRLSCNAYIGLTKLPLMDYRHFVASIEASIVYTLK